MTPTGLASAGDQARVSIAVAVPRARAFRVFTEEIDAWWRRGLRYRVAGRQRSIIHLEAGVGGRLLESIETGTGTRVIESGRVTVWEPPARLAFEWRATNFAPEEKTEVEVGFEEQGAHACVVTVTHRGWSAIRLDHPARHGHDVGAFLRMMGLWWADLLAAFRHHTAGSS